MLLYISRLLPKLVVHYFFNYFITVITAQRNAESTDNNFIVFNSVNLRNGNNIGLMYGDKRVVFQVSGVYHSTSYDGTKRVKEFGTLNAGIKKELEKSGGSFQLSVTDILRTERYLINYGLLPKKHFL